MFKKVISVTGKETHHFFSVAEKTWVPIVKDPDGKIQVFTDRDKAEAAARKIVGDKVAILTIGMGDEKWALFQRSEKHRVVE